MGWVANYNSLYECVERKLCRTEGNLERRHDFVNPEESTATSGHRGIVVSGSVEEFWTAHRQEERHKLNQPSIISVSPPAIWIVQQGSGDTQPTMTS